MKELIFIVKKLYTSEDEGGSKGPSLELREEGLREEDGREGVHGNGITILLKGEEVERVRCRMDPYTRRSKKGDTRKLRFLMERPMTKKKRNQIKIDSTAITRTTKSPKRMNRRRGRRRRERDEEKKEERRKQRRKNVKYRHY